MRNSMNFRKRWIGAVLFGSLSLGFVACEQETVKEAAQPPKVTVAKPEMREVSVFKSFPSTLEAIAEVEVRARVSGLLEAIHFTEGAFVEKGTPLFDIERAPYELAVEGAQADLERAQAGSQLAHTKLKRLKKALKTNAVSEIEVEIAAAELAQSEAAVRQAEAKLDDVLVELAYTKIAAPIAGRVSAAEVDVENLVSSLSSSKLTSIVDDSLVHAIFEVPERDALSFLTARGSEDLSEYFMSLDITLELADRSVYSETGKIDFVDNAVDPSTRTIRMRAVFENPDEQLAAGLYANVKIPVPPNPAKMDSRDAILVPAACVLRDIAGRYVWIVDAENTVQRAGIEVGQNVVKAAENTGESPLLQTVVLAGLDGTEQVIVSGLQRVRDGAVVQAEMQIAEAP